MPVIHQSRSEIPQKLKGLHLFHFDGAPCAQRVRFSLGEKGLARGREVKFDSVCPSAIEGEQGRWVSRIVSLPKKQHMTKTYAEIHPNMVVPALVHDGRLILESMDIIEYLDDEFGGTALIPKPAALREDTMQRVEQAKALHRSIRYVSFYWGLGRLAMLKPQEQQALVQLASEGGDGENLVKFYEGYSRQTIPQDIYYEHLRKLYDAFSHLDKEFTDGRLYFMSDDISIADAFWSMKVLKLIEVGYPMRDYHPNVYAWYKRVYERPSFQNEVMSNNRLMNRFFRTKSFIENFLGVGLKKALLEVSS